MRIMILDDGETWSAAEGGRLIDVPNNWTTEDIEAGLTCHEDHAARLRHQMFAVVEFDLLASDAAGQWRQHLIAGLMMLREALPDLPAHIRGTATKLGAFDLASAEEIDAWVWTLKSRGVPLTSEADRAD